MANYENPSSTNGSHRQSNVGQRVGQVTDSAQQFISEARGAVHDLGDMIDVRGRVERNPYAMLAVAAGVGYVLGGGLFTPLTARLLKLGVRLAALPFIKDELITMAETALDGFVGGARGPSGDAGPVGPQSV